MNPRSSCNAIAAVLTFSLAAYFGQAAVRAQGAGPVIPAKAELTQLDQPLSMLHEAKRNYSAVKDYSCTLVSQENVKGTLQEENIIQLKVKTQPFSVHMRWLGPKKFQGQEAAYVIGKNNNKMRVKSTFLPGLGFHSIDVNDPRVFQHSRHTIVEAGIGNMIEGCVLQWDKERLLGKTKVDIREYNYNKRDGYRIELTRTERRPEFTAFRTVIFLEKNSKMPILLENYDWPRQGGRPEGELLEKFCYTYLQFNTGLTDAEFNK